MSRQTLFTSADIVPHGPLHYDGNFIEEKSISSRNVSGVVWIVL